MPCLEPVLMIRPGLPRAIMPGAKTCEPLMMPQRLTARIRSQFSRGPNIWLPGWMPALFMRISVPPKRCRTALSSCFTLSRLPTSTVMVMTSAAPPGAADDSFASASFRRSAPMSAMQTFMPKRAKRMAAANPIPDAPPVMTATLLADIAEWGLAEWGLADWGMGLLLIIEERQQCGAALSGIG